MNISHTVLLINFNVDLPLESSSSSVVELSVETFGSLEESKFLSVCATVIVGNSSPENRTNAISNRLILIFIVSFIVY